VARPPFTLAGTPYAAVYDALAEATRS
jgi:hypothetical protein